ncbi:heterokaryon incompatibility protein-domain-containing protein [Hypoxylon trugodes]|uniref:heterokaryon incompatibility protein-domain-containing protein n=1 Tax=Hypoxylon trugodes TaxID=326681 RepID=UPI00219C1592|nr:heterokaryon incompatibility protein-domain-containing protein [Hypoxylon trugodes]KAI1391057.1 heterokaryon incompatibility protein-domain-containing protein [Hypoxylon trugodes]
MDLATRPEPFKYQPLRTDEIRLISLIVEHSSIIRCYLHHARLWPNTSFRALSYVWGNTENMKTILVNGRSLRVTENLHAALLEFRRRLLEGPEILVDEDPRTFDLWVDAICINQIDMDEKALQIPRMGDIYSMGEQVVAWLGPIAPEEHDAVQEMTVLLEDFERQAGHPKAPLREVIEKYIEESLKENNARSELSRLMATLKRVGANTWFTRIWIAQEVVLAREEPILLLGPVSMSLRVLLSAWIYLVFRSDYVKSSTPLTYFRLRGFYLLPNEAELSSLDTAHLEEVQAFSMLRWLDRTYQLNATVPHDRIYGLLGLFRGRSRSILPNYNQPYENVYFQYVKFILFRAKDTRVLGLGPVGALRGVPSWVPDLRTQVPIGVDDEPGNPVCSHFSFSTWTDVLTLPGIILGTCISVFPTQPPRTMNEPTHPPSTFLDCEKAILTVSSSITKIPRDQLLQQWLRSRVSRFFQDDPHDWPDGFEQAFLDAYESMIRSKTFIRPNFGMRIKPTMDEEAHDLLHSAKWQQMILGQGSFVLEDGTTGFLWGDHANPEPGDILCVFPALTAPILVRSNGKSQYIMVGTVTLDKYPRGLDDNQEEYQSYCGQFMSMHEGAQDKISNFDIV